MVSVVNPCQKGRQTFTNIRAFKLFPTWPHEPKCGASPASHHITTDKACQASVESAHKVPASIPSCAHAGHTAQAHAARVRAAVPTLSAQQSSSLYSEALPPALLISDLPIVLFPLTTDRDHTIKTASQISHFI